MIVLALVRNRRLCVAEAGDFYGIECQSFILRAAEAIPVDSQQGRLDVRRIIIIIPQVLLIHRCLVHSGRWSACIHTAVVVLLNFE